MMLCFCLTDQYLTAYLTVGINITYSIRLRSCPLINPNPKQLINVRLMGRPFGQWKSINTEVIDLGPSPPGRRHRMGMRLFNALISP